MVPITHLEIMLSYSSFCFRCEFRSIRATKSAIECIKKAIERCCARILRPRIVLVSDTPSFVREITPFISEFAEVIHGLDKLNLLVVILYLLKKNKNL